MMLVRYDLVAGVLTPRPIAIPMNPENSVLNPGLSNEELKQTSHKGEVQSVLTYLSETLPELQLTFGGAGPEIEAAMINRIAATETSQESWVYFEASATGPSIAGRVTGQHGFEVALQEEGESEAIVYYIDPLTKLAKPLTVVDATPTGDELIIGANLALTLSAELVAAGADIYGWVPGVTFANSTKIGSATPVLYGAYLEGVCFDETVRTLTCNRLSWLPGGNFEKAPQRSLNFRVVPDASDDTGLGYSIKYFRGTVAL